MYEINMVSSSLLVPAGALANSLQMKTPQITAIIVAPVPDRRKWHTRLTRRNQTECQTDTPNHTAQPAANMIP